MDAELASAYFASLSIFLTRGEDLVIDTARYHRDFITDPLLKQRVTSLIGQEAIHSKMHEELNDAYLIRDLPVKLFRTWAGWAFEYGFERLPQPMKLSLMAGIEHFTAVFAEYMMNHEEVFFRSQDENNVQSGCGICLKNLSIKILLSMCFKNYQITIYYVLLDSFPH
jgi:predicted metal-dependent hydrolase